MSRQFDDNNDFPAAKRARLDVSQDTEKFVNSKIIEFIEYCNSGDIEGVRIIIDEAKKNDSINLLLSKEFNFVNDYGIAVRTFPLMFCISEDCLDIAKLLLENGANPNQGTAGYDAAFPLYIAVQEGHEEIVDSLLKAGANPNQPRANNGITPLIIAAQEGYADIVRLLLENGADVNQGIEDGEVITPLITAAQQGRADIVILLLENGANPNQATIDEGNTPLIAAVQQGYADIVRLLLENGANPNQATIDEIDEGNTPLWFISSKDDRDYEGDTIISLLINAIYESEEINFDLNRFKIELQKAKLTGDDRSNLINGFIVDICRSDEPLAAMTLALLILANPDQKDRIERILRYVILSVSGVGYNENIQTPQMAHYAQKIFADDQDVLAKIPENLTNKLSEVENIIAKSVSRVDGSGKNPKYSSQKDEDFDIFAKQVAKTINAVLNESFLSQNLDKESASNLMRKVSLNSYLTLKAMQPKFESFVDRQYLLPASKEGSIFKISTIAVTTFLMAMNRNRQQVFTNDHPSGDTQIQEKQAISLPSELVDQIIEQLFFEQLKPQKKLKLTLPENITDHINLGLNNVEKRLCEEYSSKAATILHDVADVAYSKEGFKEFYHYQMSKIFNNKKNVLSVVNATDSLGGEMSLQTQGQNQRSPSPSVVKSMSAPAADIMELEISLRKLSSHGEDPRTMGN